MPPRLVLAPEVPDVAALGAQRPEDFWDGARALATAARAERVRDGVVRVPLPGTPDAHGRRLELPRGIGTGWLRVHAFRAGPAARLGARLRAPRSTSPAARRWNMACHLLAHAVAAPRPLLLFEDGARSLLVEAELEGFEPLPTWWAAHPDAATRALASAALDQLETALARCGARLPGLGAGDVWLRRADAADDDCAAAGIARRLREQAVLSGTGYERRRAIACAVAEPSPGRIARAARRARTERPAWRAGFACRGPA